MMINHFVNRNLNRTINFLCEKGIGKECFLSFDTEDLYAISCLNSKKLYYAYTSLLCESSKKHLNSVVFCTCCSSSKNFIRGHSLIQQHIKSTIKAQEKSLEEESQYDSTNHNAISIVKIPNYRIDPFLNYLEALVEQDKEIAIEILITVINEVPLFWDAYILLCELTDKFISIDTSLAPYFYLELKVSKDIDPPHMAHPFNKGSSFSISSLPYNTDFLDVNSKAALNYCYGNQALSLEQFKSIDLYKSYNISYFEIFGMLMYNNDEVHLQIIAENLNNFYKFQPETYVMLGLYKLFLKNYFEAIPLFKKAIKKKKAADTTCLLAYAYMKIGDFDASLVEYKEALNQSSNNFRIFYAVAQGLFSMNKYEVSLWYCKKALDIRADGTIYKLMGRIYISLSNIENSLQYFELALLHNEVDSLLYIADAYRKKNEMHRALELYERYVEQGKKNVKVVVKYLVDYYEEHGNQEKLKYFREVYRRLEIVNTSVL